MMASSSNSCSKCGYTTRYESIQMHTLPCRHNVCEFCLKDIPGLLDGHILSCPDCGSCFQYVRPLEEIDGEAGNTHSHEKRTGTGKDYRAVSENEKNEAIEEMSSQGWGRRYDHHSGKLTSTSSQNAPEVSQQKENAHVANRVNVSGNDYSQNPARVGHTNHDYGQPANHGYYQELPAKWSTESYHERGTSARSSESGDSSRLEEPSRRKPTIHTEDKDDGRGSTYCSEHNRPVYFFCPICDVLICAACSEGEHKSHGATKIDDSPDDVNHDNNQVGSEVQHGNPERPPKCPSHDRPCTMVSSYYDTPQHSSSSHMYHTQNLHKLPMNNHPETKPPNTSYGPTESGLYETIPPMTGGASYEPPVHERGISALSSESGDSSRLEEPSRRKPTIHTEDKDDERGSTYCSEHNRPVYFFCPACNVLICAACSEGEHKSHRATKIDDSPDDVNHDNNQVGSEVQHGNPERPPKCPSHDRPCTMVSSYYDTPQHSSSSHMYHTQNLHKLPMNNHPETKPPNTSYGPTESGLYETIPPMTGGASYEPPVHERGISALSSESGDSSRLEEPSRRTPTIHTEDKDDGRGSTYCSEHNRPVYFFCPACNVLICAACSEGEHKSHRATKIDDSPDDVNHDNNQVGSEVQHGNPERPPKCPSHDRPCTMVSSYYDTPQHSSSFHMYHTQSLRKLPMNNHPETKPPNTSYGPTESGLYETIPPMTGGASYEPPVHERGTSPLSSESGDSSRLEEPSRRKPTIHTEDKDDGRRSTFCSKHNKPLYFFCPACNALICATCREVKHKSHRATKIDDSPDDVNHDNNQVGSEVQHVNPERPPKCPSHDRPCSMVCKYKINYICNICHFGHNCCPRSWSDHVYLTSARSELLRKVKEFERKMKSVESKKDKATETGESNIDTIMRETEALKMGINAATEKAKERLDAYRNDVVAKIDKVAEEKLYSCTRAVESLNSVTGFLQQARQMKMECQREAERGQYLKAMQSVQQIENVIGNIDKTITQNNIKEDKLGLQVREESFRDPFKVTKEGMW